VSIRYRQMLPKDVRECVDVIAAHPIVGPRYGSAITDLRTAWLNLLGRDAFTPVVFEEIRGSDVRILGVGVTVFVSDDFTREIKTPPLFWIGPELARRVARGDSPVLSDKELQEANSGAGLNLFVWQTGLLPEDLKRPEVTSKAMATFSRFHRGFLLKELILQPESPEYLHGLCNAGALLLNPAHGSYAEFHVSGASDFLTRPCVIGGTREKVLSQLVSWAYLLFVYQPPQCGFTRSEQQLVLSALDGGTDEELAESLYISVSAVKKMWHSIYDRVGVCLPELLPHSATDAEPSERGKEKRRRLLAYLLDHPEELRPVSRRLLKQSADLRDKCLKAPLGN
jgi:hypothetical protein